MSWNRGGKSKHHTNNRHHPYAPLVRPQSSWQAQSQGGPSRQPLPHINPALAYAAQAWGYDSYPTHPAQAPQQWYGHQAYNTYTPPQPYPYPQWQMSNPQPQPTAPPSAQSAGNQPAVGPRYPWEIGARAGNGPAPGRNLPPKPAGGTPPAQRAYSTRSTTASKGNGARGPSKPAAPPGVANRRVSELGGQAAASGSGSYQPPHRRGQSVPVSSGQAGKPGLSSTTPSTPRHYAYGDTADSSFDSSATSPSTRHRRERDFVITLPTDKYISLSDPAIPDPPHKAQGGSTKLLVLDLNGALIYRDKRTAERRRSFPRPYLSSFLEYLFLPEPIFEAYNGEHGGRRPWEVFVWSSAQPGNVRGMVEASFGEAFVEGIWTEEKEEERAKREDRGEGRVVGVWARDKLGLSARDYGQKVQTVKDLRLLSAHLNFELPKSKSRHLRDLRFDESNMVLLDDSPLKAVHQPWNEIILPEYEKEAYQSARLAAVKDEQDGETVPEGMDDALICVVGILEEMRGVQNVPAWIRSGGLTPTLDTVGNPTTTTTTPLPIPTLDNLPTHESFQHWHGIPSIRSYWLKRGKAALRHKGIELRHGMDSAAAINGGVSPMWSPLRSPQAGNNAEMARINDALGSSSLSGTPTRRARVYSPSRQMEASMSPKSQSSALTPPPESNSAPSRSDRAGGYGSPAARKTKSQPANRTETWRTFKASDVGRFLLDMSDRASVPLTDEQRAALRTVSSLMEELDPPPSEGEGEEDEEMGEDERAVCVGCTARQGEAEGNRLSKRMRMEIRGMFSNHREGVSRRRGQKRDIEALEEDEEMAGPSEAADITHANSSSDDSLVGGLTNLDINLPASLLRPTVHAGVDSDIAEASDDEDLPAGEGPPARGPGLYVHPDRQRYHDPSFGPRRHTRASSTQPPVAQGTSSNSHPIGVQPYPALKTPAVNLLIAKRPARRGKPSKAEVQLDRLETYNTLRSTFDSLIDQHAASGSADTLARVRNAHKALEGLRGEIKMGRKSKLPSVIDFLAHWEQLPGREFWGPGGTKKEKAAERKEKKNLRKGIRDVAVPPALPPRPWIIRPEDTAKAAAKSAPAVFTRTRSKKLGPGIPPDTSLHHYGGLDWSAHSVQGVRTAEMKGEAKMLKDEAWAEIVRKAMKTVDDCQSADELDAQTVSLLINEGQRRLGNGEEYMRSDGRGGWKVDPHWVYKAEQALATSSAPARIGSEGDKGEDREEGNPGSWVVKAFSGAADPERKTDLDDWEKPLDLDEWRKTAFLDLTVPQGGRGRLTILVLRQIYQDLGNPVPLSHPLHIGQATLSPKYARDLSRLRKGKMGGSRMLGRDSVALAMREADRLIRVRAGENADASDEEEEDEPMEPVEIYARRSDEGEAGAAVGMPPIVRRAPDDAVEEDIDPEIEYRNVVAGRYFAVRASGAGERESIIPPSNPDPIIERGEADFIPFDQDPPEEPKRVIRLSLSAHAAAMITPPRKPKYTSSPSPRAEGDLSASTKRRLSDATSAASLAAVAGESGDEKGGRKGEKPHRASGKAAEAKKQRREEDERLQEEIWAGMSFSHGWTGAEEANTGTEERLE